MIFATRAFARHARAKPLRQRAVRLEPQPKPGKLHDERPQAMSAVLLMPCSRCMPPLTKGVPASPHRPKRSAIGELPAKSLGRRSTDKLDDCLT